jgi:hypothetical protein
MFWFLYLVASILISFVIAKNRKHNLEIFILSFVVFVTPAQIEITSTDYAPSLFAFIFNLVLENNFSSRLLRPLVLSVPVTLVILSMYRTLKRKFF